MSWTLFGLCQNLEAQRRLREEPLALHTDDPKMDELKSLPYLGMVVRESPRLYSPVFVVWRQGIKDTVLPMKDGSSIRYVSAPVPQQSLGDLIQSGGSER